MSVILIDLFRFTSVLKSFWHVDRGAETVCPKYMSHMFVYVTKKSSHRIDVQNYSLIWKSLIFPVA